MIRLMSYFELLTPQHLEYLLSLLNPRATPLERSAVATTLGNWLARAR